MTPVPQSRRSPSLALARPASGRKASCPSPCSSHCPCRAAWSRSAPPAHQRNENCAQTAHHAPRGHRVPHQLHHTRLAPQPLADDAGCEARVGGSSCSLPSLAGRHATLAPSLSSRPHVLRHAPTRTCLAASWHHWAPSARTLKRCAGHARGHAWVSKRGSSGGLE